MSSGNPFKTEHPRQVLIGAAGTLCAFGAFLGFRWIVHQDPPPPGEWLCEAEQEVLADARTEFDGWVAGCLWEDRNFRDIREVVDEPTGLETMWRSEASSGRTISLLVVEEAAGS